MLKCFLICRCAENYEDHNFCMSNW